MNTLATTTKQAHDVRRCLRTAMTPAERRKCRRKYPYVLTRGLSRIFHSKPKPKPPTMNGGTPPPTNGGTGGNGGGTGGNGGGGTGGATN